LTESRHAPCRVLPLIPAADIYSNLHNHQPIHTSESAHIPYTSSTTQIKNHAFFGVKTLEMPHNYALISDPSNSYTQHNFSLQNKASSIAIAIIIICTQEQNNSLKGLIRLKGLSFHVVSLTRRIVKRCVSRARNIMYSKHVSTKASKVYSNGVLVLLMLGWSLRPVRSTANIHPGADEVILKSRGNPTLVSPIQG